ncbi:SDR family NAD(P)-dependent oxidoreductase [Gymnodinialimonas hymeniacidonis]|uniref:SDR family NAD(P)-dependent oxidoreductase n=1 Tax=Gymnodinialimonas hymeniacidonis TaxID=3126508 RepID=UPI0034C653B2
MHILITGGNRGIGLGLAEQYRAAGHTVTATSRDGSTGVALDVTDAESVRALAGAVSEPVDLLVCNAGVYLDKCEDLEGGYAPELWAKTFAANVTGVFLTVQVMLPHLRAAEGAKIAIISSQMGSSTKAPGNSLIYRTSKAAALNLGINLSNALKPEGIAVGIYHPGWVQTDMGGAEAGITVDESVAGLSARFAALGLENTGCFENWDGRPHAI